MSKRSSTRRRAARPSAARSPASPARRWIDDTNLHDAANGSDPVRVVLWLDVARKLPSALALYNRTLLAALYHEPSIRRFRENAVVRLRGAGRVSG